MRALLDSYVASGKPLQVKFADSSDPPIGPGKIEHVTFEPSSGISYYRMEVPGQLGQGRTTRSVVVPIVFTADRVLWVTEGPQEVAQSAITTVGAGGIHIG